MDQREDEEATKTARRLALRDVNSRKVVSRDDSPALDSSLKRHTSLIKRIKQSLGMEHRDQILKDLETLSLGKYIDEIAAATVDGIARCKTDRDVWSAVEIISALHRRFPDAYTLPLISLLSNALVPLRVSNPALSGELKEKEEAIRIARQRPLLRVASELAFVRVITDGPGRSGGEWVMKTLKELLSNDPTFASLPLLNTFLKAFATIFFPAQPANVEKSSSSTNDPATVDTQMQGQAEELVELNIRERFRKMCAQYFEQASKKLVKEYDRLQEQEKRNHEAYIRSGEVFEDRQQAYEKMTKNYERLSSGCQLLSDALQLPMPTLRQNVRAEQTIGVSFNSGSAIVIDGATSVVGGPWEDDEERKFYEDIMDLSELVPRSVLGIDHLKSDDAATRDNGDDTRNGAQEKEDALFEQINLELANLAQITPGGETDNQEQGSATEVAESASTPPSHTPKGAETPPIMTEPAGPTGPSQLLGAMLLRLPDATTPALIDALAVEFAFLNSKAARNRVIKYLSQVPKNRLDLIPYYSRFIATSSKYMPDIGEQMVLVLEEEFRYLNKKRTVKELAESRMKNITFVSALVKFQIIPSHSILHMFKVFLDNFSGQNVENVALMLEGCGRYLLRSPQTAGRMAVMIELMKRKQSLMHFDQRQLMLLENAYYQCNPSERSSYEEKQRSHTELFIRHLLVDILNRKSIDKVLRLIRKLDWAESKTVALLHKYCTRPWKLRHSSISLLAMLIYDLQRYHPDFTVGVVGQILEDVRRGLENNKYADNRRRISTIRYLGELYIYRVIGSGIVFDTLWSLTTYGHADGRSLPNQVCSIDSPDDFFRVRLICMLLDTCGMCFDKGSQKKKLDHFLLFFQAYVLSKESIPMDIEFMYLDTMESLRPSLEHFKTFEAVQASIEQVLSTFIPDQDAQDEEEDSEEERVKQKNDEEVEEDPDTNDSRAVTPEPLLVRSSKDNLGPTEEAAAEFEKELAKMVTDANHESRKVDKKTALALWDSSLPIANARKKRFEGSDDGTDAFEESASNSLMRFTVITRRGHKQQARELSVPASSALAVQTRTAQIQDKAEQQELKRIVLDYEQREEEASRQTKWHGLSARNTL